VDQSCDAGRDHEIDQARSAHMTESSYPNYPDEPARAVGRVILSAAWAEDKAGELVTLNHGSHEATPHRDWAASGDRLCKALGAVAPQAIAERLKRGLEFRHQVVHGVFLWDSNEVAGPTLKRKLGKTGPASFEMPQWSIQSLSELAEEFRLSRS
jgi:hypothetical protein